MAVDPIVTTTDFKTFVGITDTSSDTVLTYIAEGVTKRFHGYCGRTWATATGISEIHDAGPDGVVVRRGPIIEIGSVWVSVAGTWDNSTLLSSDYYESDSGGDVIWWRNYTPPEASRGVRVTYTGGYSEIPEDVQMAFIRQVDHEFNHGDQFGLKRQTDPTGNSVDLVGYNLLPEVRAILDHHRRIPL